MSDDRTVLKKGRPFFAINEVAYARASATKGFIEPLYISGVQFDPARNEWLYSWRVSMSISSKASPIQCYESELLTLCEALPIQISVLKRELAEICEKMHCTCPDGGTTPPDPQQPTIINDKVGVNYRMKPPAPRFGFNEVVYLRETAQVLGRLEAYRITDLEWSNDLLEWKYIMLIKPRPGRNMTIGDRDDKNHPFEIWYPESQLSPVCEALPLAVAFMQKAVKNAEARLKAFCGGS